MLTEGRAHGMLTRWFSARAKLKRMDKEGQPEQAAALKAEAMALRQAIVDAMLAEREC